MVAIDAAEASFTAAPAPVDVATETGITPNAQALSATDAIAMPRHHGVLRSSWPVTSTSAQSWNSSAKVQTTVGLPAELERSPLLR